MKRQLLVNVRTGETLATDLEVAGSVWQRTRGLLGRSELPPGGGMRFDGTNSIHMFFMRFAIDVLYLDREDCVVKLVHHLPPWRVSAAWGAHATIELPAGTLRQRDIKIGDRIDARPVQVAP